MRNITEEFERAAKAKTQLPLLPYYILVCQLTYPENKELFNILCMCITCTPGMQIDTDTFIYLNYFYKYSSLQHSPNAK